VERRGARSDLDAGRVQVLCVVDIYNEGVDVPNVNTLFFFRPTESATVFLQQFGRGLRRAPAKAELVVFDLTGRQHLQFRFDRGCDRYSATRRASWPSSFQGIRAASGWLSSALRRAGPRRRNRADASRDSVRPGGYSCLAARTGARGSVTGGVSSRDRRRARRRVPSGINRGGSCGSRQVSMREQSANKRERR
jgi:hypothetical protein